MFNNPSKKLIPLITKVFQLITECPLLQRNQKQLWTEIQAKGIDLQLHILKEWEPIRPSTSVQRMKGFA